MLGPIPRHTRAIGQERPQVEDRRAAVGGNRDAQVTGPSHEQMPSHHRDGHGGQKHEPNAPRGGHEEERRQLNQENERRHQRPLDPAPAGHEIVGPPRPRECQGGHRHVWTIQVAPGVPERKAGGHDRDRHHHEPQHHRNRTHRNEDQPGSTSARRRERRFSVHGFKDDLADRDERPYTHGT
jgi:hypothetical protein